MIRQLALAALLPMGLVCFTSLATAQVCPGDDVFEPNQSCATAVMLTSGITPALSIVGTNHDMWGFTVPAGEDLTIDVFFLHANGNIDVKLVTSDCNNLYDRGDSVDDDEHVIATNTGATPVVMVLHVFKTGSNFVCNDYSVGAIIGQPNMSANCFGDGAGSTCPCGNNGAPGEGCANSTTAGATLSATGSSSTTADDLVLSGSQLPANKPGLYFQGPGQVVGGSLFGDGLLCVSGSIQRMETVFSDGAGNSSTSIPIASTFGATPGTTAQFQLWYRDQAGPCGSQFNTSNAYMVTWAN